MGKQTSTRRLATRIGAIGVAMGLAMSALVAAPAVAAPSPLSMSITVDTPRDTFKAGEKITVVATLTNTTKASLTLPEEAVLRLSTAASLEADRKIAGGCEISGAGGGGPYHWEQYALELPSSVPPGKSFSCTYTHTAAPEDVANGGIYGELSYVSDGRWGSDSSDEFWYYLLPADGQQQMITVAGTPMVGKTLTARLGYWAMWDGVAEYQWMANGKAIMGATASSYTPTAAEQGKKLTVDVVRHDDWGGWIGASSDPTKAVAGKVMTAATPVVSGTVKVGSTLTAKAGKWTSKTKLSYQWLASGKTIKGATKSTYKIPSSLVGKTISVKVTGTQAGYTTTAKTSKATGKVLKSASPKITGTAKVGRAVTVKPGAWSSRTTFSYQWYANGKAIKGATKSTYKIPLARAGQKLTVKVTGKKSGYASVAVTSASRTITR